MATRLQLRVDARPECIRPLRNAVAGVACDIGLSDSQLYAVKLCLTEAVTNVVSHAYAAGEEGLVDVGLREVAHELEIVVMDQGRESHREAALDRGGFGLGFISRLTNRCTFTAAPDGTTVEMRFPLPNKRPGQRTRPVGSRSLMQGRYDVAIPGPRHSLIA
jgi:anti-sigma regulatory factor (Ser/Thr protein kinase)